MGDEVNGTDNKKAGEDQSAPAGKTSSLPGVKLIVQQCLTASLKVIGDELEPDNVLAIGRGIVVYLCFSSGATEQLVDKAVRLVLGARLSQPSEDGTEASNEVKSKTKGRVSIVDLPGDILVVPQATLGGRFNKGTQPQYHGNCDVTIGKQLYDRFINTLRDTMTKHGRRVEAGRYGSRQPLAMETDGPYTHIIEV